LVWGCHAEISGLVLPVEREVHISCG
jgi:hypothetical protein